MAFQLPNTSETQSADNRANAQWKNDAFINVYLPTGDGGKKKLGSIGLKIRKSAEAELINFLKADPSNVTKLLATAEVDFQMVDGSTSAGFALPTAE